MIQNMQTVVLKCSAIWAAFIPIAILNGFIRDKFLVPLLGQRNALPISGITCALLFFILTWFSLPLLGPLKTSRYWLIGLSWFVMTVLFEFLLGRFVALKSWTELLQAYDITTGNLWLLVLAIVAVSPFLTAKLQGMVP